jgi:hypothetical protein
LKGKIGGVGEGRASHCGVVVVGDAGTAVAELVAVLVEVVYFELAAVACIRTEVVAAAVGKAEGLAS